jgi:predicted MFS family arabinose efflux permease
MILPNSRFMPRLAVGLAGFAAMMNMYAPQAVLPLLADEFGVGPAGVSQIMTVNALAVALTAPFTGALADVAGRRRVIAFAMALLVIPDLMMAFSPALEGLLFWRFVQGFLLPPIFAVSIAYIGSEWPPNQATGVTGLFITATAVGGFTGRMLIAVLAEPIGWRHAFFACAAITALCAIAVLVTLPAEKNFVRAETFRASLRQMLRHLREKQLLATYAVGFGIMFNFIAAFTFIGFVLAAEPFSLSPAAIGLVFVVYLSSLVTTPYTGWLVSRFGRRQFSLMVIAVWTCGILLTLVPSLPAIVGGLMIAAACGFYVQTCCQSFVSTHVSEGKSSAIGLYVTSFYIGGSFGGLVPGLLWNISGWQGTVSLIVAMLLFMAAMIRFAWRKA